jgi:hypothetical protein
MDQDAYLNDSGLKGRQLYAPRSDDPYANLSLLADLIAKLPDIFDHEGRLVWLDAGVLHIVNKDLLPKIIREHIVIQVLVNRGTAEKQNWERAFRPLEVDQRTLILLLREPRERGGLNGRIAKAYRI